jgi:hypothetical protein
MPTTLREWYNDLVLLYGGEAAIEREIIVEIKRISEKLKDERLTTTQKRYLAICSLYNTEWRSAVARANQQDFKDYLRKEHEENK